MASWNTSLLISNLSAELTDIAYFTGYITKLIPVNGAIVTSNNTSVTTTNNIQYAYSTNDFLNSWNAEATPITNTNMFIGVSKNINQVYAGASSISMQMVDYGVIIDNQSNNVLTIFLIKNGAINFTPTITDPNQLAPVKMAYLDGSINFYINGVVKPLFTQTGLTLENCSLIVGGFVGGTLQNIVWTGTGGTGGGGGAQTLAETLQFGNDGGGKNILNVSSVQTPILYGASNRLAFSSDNAKNKIMDIQTITTPLNPQVGNPILSVYNQSGTQSGRVYDNYFNSPIQTFLFSLQSGSSASAGPIYPTVGKSILSFPLNKSYTNFDLNLSALDFTYDKSGPAIPSGQGIFIFYITATKDAPYSENLGSSFTTPDISNDNTFLSTDNIILYYTNTNTSQLLYLNVLYNYNDGYSVDLNNLNIVGEFIASSFPFQIITPSIIST